MSIIDTMQARLDVLAPSHLDIQDDSAAHAGHAGAGSGGHYDLLIVSAAFNGKNRVQR